VILVIGNIGNEAASSLVEAFEPGAASFVTASNLHETFKAAIAVNDFGSSALTIGKHRLSPSQISSVITTVAYFIPEEFYYVEASDREYVCAEVSAFFVYFLSELRCRKLNPPTSRSLSGLGMHRIEWMKAACGLGIPVWAPQHEKGMPTEATGGPDFVRATFVRATIVGDAVVEKDVPAEVCGFLRVLSRKLGMPYLCGDFAMRTTGQYLLANLWSVPDISSPANREAMVRFLNGTHA